MKVALIDADSLYYILGWNMRERLTTEGGQDITEDVVNGRIAIDFDSGLAMEMYGAVDQAIIGILQATGANNYLGAIGDKEKCFRYNVAKFKPYKAKRGEPMPWLKLWKPVIEHRFREEWGFISVPGLEADDIISLAHERYIKAISTVNADDNTNPYPAVEQFEVIVCSPDKDMRQLPGTHFDYKKLDFADVSHDQAAYNLAYQMIAGDTSDGVAGIPGAGEKKAKEKLAEGIKAGLFPDQVVRSMYYKHFGDYYGNIIYNENMMVLQLLTSHHTFFDVFEESARAAMKISPVPEGINGDAATLDTLKQLGWG